MPRSESGKHLGPTTGSRVPEPSESTEWDVDPGFLSELPVEGAPDDGQKHRLEDWLSEMRIISRTHGIVLAADDDLHIIDTLTGRIIGIGLVPLLRQRGGRVRLIGYDARDSILDGVWPIETAQGLREQREAGRVWPRHPFRQAPSDE